MQRIGVPARGSGSPPVQVWTAQITEYWDAHLPLRFSVASGYASWALCLRGPRAGTVVHALAPEFEVNSVVAADLDAYLAQLAG